jgi:hypothetical protein
VSPELIILLLVAAASAINIILERHQLRANRIIEIVLLWSLVIGIGFSSVFAFIGHFFFADQVAESIGWARGSPFQREVAFADLSVGILGLMCFKWRGSFWLAAIVSYSIFSLGAAYGHILELQRGDLAINNAGPVLYLDIAYPLFLIALWLAFSVVKRHKQ